VNELALFAGAGGGILGGTLLGWRTVCAVECDAYCASVLVERQNEGILEPFPVWDDVRTFDGKPWRGIVDVVSGGFPCQDISCAGRGEGIDGERSGLWSEFARIIGEVRPRYAFVENSPMLVIRGGDRVIGDLTALGYDCRWGVISAADAGAPHRRERIWIVADAAGGAWNGIATSDSAGGNSGRRPQESIGGCGSDVADAAGTRRTYGTSEGNTGGVADKAGEEESGESAARRPAFAVVSGSQDVADADSAGLERRERSELRECAGELFAWTGGAYEMGDAASSQSECSGSGDNGARRQAIGSGGSGWWESESDVGMSSDGMAKKLGGS